MLHSVFVVLSVVAVKRILPSKQKEVLRPTC